MGSKKQMLLLFHLIKRKDNNHGLIIQFACVFMSITRLPIYAQSDFSACKLLAEGNHTEAK